MKKIFASLSVLLLCYYSLSAATLNLTIYNVNSAIRPNAKVVLYNSSWAYLSTVYTNSSGVASFASLSSGTYNFEVYYNGGNGDEFWGNSIASIGSTTVNQSFTRTEPIIQTASVPTSTYNLGTTVTMSVTVKSNLSFASNVQVELIVDRDKATTYDFDQTSSAKSISGGGTGTYTFTFTPTVAGTFYWKAFVKTYVNSGYIVTDTYSWTTGFSIVQPKGNFNLTVKNVDNAIRPNAKTILYDQNWNAVSTVYSNSSGISTFSQINYGTYNYEIYYNGGNGDEFWGNSTVSIASATVNQTFIRNEPIISSASVPTSSLPVNNPVSMSITVKSNLTFATNVKVELIADRNKATTYDFDQTSSSKSISGGSTGTFTFSFTPTSTGTYYWKAYVKTYVNSSYIVTDTYSWTTGFTIYQPQGNLNLTVKNVDNAIRPDAKTILYDQNWNTISTVFTNASGIASFSQLNYGTYNFEVYYNGGNGDEFWGNSSISIASGSVSQSFVRNEPIISSATIPTSTYTSGSPISMTIDVKNNLSYAGDVQVQLILDRDKTSTFDFDQTSATKSISSGGTSTFTFNFTPSLAGVYYWKAYVKTYVNSGFIITDTYSWTTGFNVKAREATIVDFTVPTGSLIRGATTQCSITLNNTGSTTRSFWVGASFAHEDATNSSWPVLWYDIKPVKTLVLSPGQSQTITLNYRIPENSRPGNYYACASIWNDFNPTEYLMVEPRYDATTNYSKWLTKETGVKSFSLGPYETDQPDIINQIKSHIELLLFGGKTIEEMYLNEGVKPLLFMTISPGTEVASLFGVPIDVAAGGTLLIDLADLFKLTPEGKDNNMVTMWIDGSLQLGLQVPGFPSIPATIGLTTHNFSFEERAIADYRKDVIISISGKLGIIPFTLVDYSFNSNNVKGPRLQAALTLGASIYLKGTKQGLVSAEVNLTQLRDLVVNAFSVENTLESCVAILRNQLISYYASIIGSTIRKATWDDGSWPLYDGIWESNLKLSKQFDLSNDRALYAHHFYLDVPVSASSLNIAVGDDAGYGNADLFLKYGGRPDLVGKPYLISNSLDNNENLNIVNPQAGRWYIMLPSTSVYEKVRINAQVTSTATSKLNSGFSNLVKIYPNPSNGEFELVVEYAELSKISITIINAQGQVLSNEKTENLTGQYSKQMHLRDLPAGLYVLKIIINESKVEYNRIIIK